LHQRRKEKKKEKKKKSSSDLGRRRRIAAKLEGELEEEESRSNVGRRRGRKTVAVKVSGRTRTRKLAATSEGEQELEGESQQSRKEKKWRSRRKGITRRTRTRIKSPRALVAMKCAGALTRKARNRRRQGVLTGEDCVSSEEEDDVVVGKMKKKREEEGEITVVAGDAGNNVMRAAVAACGEESVTKQWPALLQSKCEVLEMEKELAMQRWTQQCVEIAKTAPTTAEEMSHCVMQATKRRGTVSAPCTPRTTTTNKKEEEQEGEEEDSVQLVHRIEQLQKSRQQRELENQANAVQGRVQLLQQRSKTRYGGVRIVQRNKENLGRELDPSTLISVRSASSLVLP
jgi:hypothetical protein